MAKTFPLQPLIDLAQERSRSAAQALAKLKHGWQEAENKLLQLQTYLREYQNRLHLQTQSGLSVQQWRDYQAFMHKLELAIQAQLQEVERCRRMWDAGQVEWQACEREVKAYQTLRDRHDETERKQDAKLEQRLQDEFARNLEHRKRKSEE